MTQTIVDEIDRTFLLLRVAAARDDGAGEATGTRWCAHVCDPYLSRNWAGRDVTVVRYGRRVVILDGTRLLRRITLHPGRRYEPADPDTPPPR